MDRFLPSILEWGPWLWRGVIVGFALLVLGGVLAIRYVRARARARRAAAPVLRDPRAIRGVLRGTSALITTDVEGYALGSLRSSGSSTWRSSELWLDTADRRIALVGPLRVVVGARFTARRDKLPRLPAGAREAVHAELPWSKSSVHGAIVHTLAAGDEIAVRGLPQPRPGTGESTGREADIAWTLEGTTEAPLELVAVARRAPRLPLGIVRGGLIVGLALGAAKLGMVKLGDRWRDECTAIGFDRTAARDRPIDQPLELGNDHPCILAASVADDRSQTLPMIRTLLDAHPYRDAAVGGALVELSRETQGCLDRIVQASFTAQYELALEEARMCGDLRAEHEALVALGRFEEALQVPIPPEIEELPKISTLIAAKRWKEAAARLDARVAEDEANPTRGRLRERDRCVVELLRHRAGDPAALAVLRRVVAERQAAGGDQSSCTGILAQLDPATRRRWLGKDADDGSAAMALLVELGGTPLPSKSPFADVLTLAEDRRADLLRLWLPPPSSPILALHTRAARAAFDDDPAAGELARAAVALASTTREVDLDETIDRVAESKQLVAAVALYGSEILTLDAASYPRRLRLRHTTSNDGDLAARYGRLFDLKRTGDGRLLLRELDPHGSRRYEGDLLAILPYAKTHRAAIAAALPYASAFTSPDHVFYNAHRAVLRRELFEALDAPAEAAKWQAVYRRHVEVFEDRDRLIALLLVED